MTNHTIVRVEMIVICFLLTSLWGMTMPTQAKEKMLSDFNSETAANQWMSVNDSVMGGISKGSFKITPDGQLVFEGTLSLENNGGFASIRTRPRDEQLADFNAVEIWFKGDGRTYYFNLRTDENRRASSYRMPIETTEGVWRKVRLPFAEFDYTSFGRKMDRPPIKPADIRSIGFMLADKRPGPFKLEIASIKAVQLSQEQLKEVAIGNQGIKQIPIDATVPADLVDIARQAGQFNTLLAAAKAAGLVEVLKNPEAQLTVFAPTDQAFGKLPDGTIESLLKPENKDRLTAILYYHILPIKQPIGGEATTLQGGTIAIELEGTKKIGGANIIKVNVPASNGLIHVIDQVLLPPKSKLTSTEQAKRLIELAIARGVPQFNQGNAAACAAIYEVAVTSLIKSYSDILGEQTTSYLRTSLQLASDSDQSRDQAWILRFALDTARKQLTKAR